MRRERGTVETSPPTSFAQQLRRLRREQRLSQVELARRAGLSIGIIRGYEAGHHHPSRPRIPQLARILGVSEDELARHLAPPTETSPFGRVLRELRERRGLTQQQLAARSGCTAHVISHYEIARTHPNPENLDAIAAALGVPPHQLSALAAERSPARQSTAFGRLIREARIARGLTLQELAREAGVPERTLANYETRNIHPQERHLSRVVASFARALDLAPAEIEESLSRPRPARVPTDFGHRLRQLRVDRGLTQEQLGARCGCSMYVISHYETGKAYPNPSLLPVLARVLDVEAGELARVLPLLRTGKASTPFAKELRRLRSQHGWTQGELARRAGVRRSSISSYEAASKRPSAPALAAFARALGVPPEQLERLLPQPKTTPLGRELRRLREQCALTQEQLATRIGRNPVTVSCYERGHRHPPTRDLPTLAQALGVSPDQLEGLSPPQHVSETTPFGRELKRLRKELGLTLAQLAKRVGCGQSNISTYERGRARPGVDTLAALARALGVPEERFAELLPPRPKTTPFGSELRRLRRERGLTLGELATRSGRSPASISSYEHGRNRPRAAGLAALARALGVSEQRLQL